MNYYEILVATKNKTNQLLTYVTEIDLKTYQIVKVPFRQQLRPGLVYGKLSARKIPKDLAEKCRPIHTVSPYCLPPKLVRSVLDLGDMSALGLSALGQLLLSNAPLKKPRQTQKEDGQPEKSQKPPLTKAQKQIYRQIKASNTCQPQLLLGVNGSGKTRLYAELIADQIKAGKSCLVLVPEIGLSKQVLTILKTYLGPDIETFHSQMKASQRKTLWIKCLTQKQPLIVVGARSAEFLPFQKLGLIVLDEFHDDSFKQETWPSYQSLSLASCLAKNYRARLICGSATPRVEDYYHFLKARYPVHYLRQRALPVAEKASILLIDKRKQKGIFAPETLQAIAATLKRQHQLLIFYNRRGNWRLAECGQCFWQAECPTCDRRLVFHHDKFEFLCHSCGRKQKPISACPNCHQAIRYSSIGLKTIESELSKHLLERNIQVPIWRFDSDNLKTETLAAKLEAIGTQSLILMGTQIIAQGLDLPNLQTVVILDAEQSLLTPDYRSQEKYYRQIHQLSGRVGRGHLPQTEVVIQSWQPDNNILNYAIMQDWSSFYRHEIKQRQKYNLPPFVYLANISIRRSSSLSSKTKAGLLQKKLCARFPRVKFYPPAPALQEKRSGHWEWLIHVQAKKRKDLLEVANYFKNEQDFFNLDPIQLFATNP